MELPTVFVFTHDALSDGEDGPTHQPVEHLASLRAIPGLVTLRPGDANEVVEAYRYLMPLRHEPAVLVLSRQPLPTIDRSKYASAAGVARGAYVLADPPDGKPDVILIATGSEIALAVEAHEQLLLEGVRSRVVSMPSWDIFEHQPQDVPRQRPATRSDGARRDRTGVSVWLGALRRFDRPGDRHADLRRLGAAQSLDDRVRFYRRERCRSGQGSMRHGAAIMSATVFDPSKITAPIAEDPANFSLVLGGPLYQLLRRSRLSDDALTLVHRRILAGVLITWVPLLLLSIVEGRAWWGSVEVPFLLNFEVHARLLLALPLLIIAELIVHMRMRRPLVQFLDRKLIRESDVPRFHALHRIGNTSAEFGGRRGVAHSPCLWARHRRQPSTSPLTRTHGQRRGGSSRFGSRSLAGWWQMLVSVPIFQFLLLRWYFRLFIWTRFLWQVSRIELQLMPTHPDRAGGLGFLATIVNAFAPFLVAHGVLLAGLIADRIFFVGATLPQFIVEITAVVGALVFVVLCPLIVFGGQLARAKRAGLAEYGVLAQRYVREFDAKWIRGDRDPAEPFVGSADVQSLADLANSFDVIRTMRFVPFSKETVFQLGVITLAPLLPLTLTMISFEELLKRLLGAVF